MSRIESVRGTQDLLPEDARRWAEAEQRMRGVLHRFGFGELRTPIFEHVELFKRPLGEGSDVVAKEMYEFTDKGGRMLALRPEGTVCAVRAYLEHGLYAKGSRHKLYYIGPIFRYDRPQAGRFRQHHQVGIEVFGDAGPSQDAEVIAMGTAMLAQLGVINYERRINSVGCQVCRPPYLASLREWLMPHRDQLCKNCSGYRIEKNVLRVLDCKVPTCRAVTAGAPVMMGSLCADCRSHFESVKAHLTSLDQAFIEDHRLVRGLDYYTRTAFEFVPADGGGTFLGGGRYDLLVELLGGPATPGIGWGMGLERVLAASPANRLTTDVPRFHAYVLYASPDAFPRALRIAQALRTGGLACELASEGKSLPSQMRSAGNSGAAFAVIVGAGDALGVKNLATHEQVEVPEESLSTHLLSAGSVGK